MFRKNPLYDDNDDPNHQSVKEKLNNPTPKSVTNEDEAIYEPIFQAFSFEFNEENFSMVKQHAENQLPIISKQWVQTNLSKPIIRPWEEIRNNKHRTRLRYENVLTFHIPDYSKPIQFVSAGFLHENLTTHVPIKLQSFKCQY